MSALVDHIVLAACAACSRRSWTPEEDAFLEGHLRVLSKAEIGAALGRSENAVKIRQVRLQIPSPSKTPGFYTGHQVARILGVDIHTIMKLQERGLMRLDVLPGERRILSIAHVSLYVWAVNPLHWIYFKPRKVRDPHLRRLIQLRKARWEDEWWTPGQARRYYGLSSSTVINHAIRCGKLPAVRWGNWYLLKSDVLAHPFYPGKGATRTLFPWSPRADAFLLRARDELGLQWQTIARRMKWDERRCMYRYHRLKGSKA